MSFLKIPQRRAIFYLLLLFVLPHIFLLNSFWARKEALEAYENEIEDVERALYRQAQKQALNAALASLYRGQETRGREEVLESLMKVKFIEGQVEKSPLFQEVPAQLSAAVHINGSELKQLLALLEDRAIPPYELHRYPALCLLTDIRLERIESDEKQQFLLNLKMLKREFL